MTNCFFVSDLHGKKDRFVKLFELIERNTPGIVFIGGDILPHFGMIMKEGNDFNFIDGFLLYQFQQLRTTLKERYPKIFLIMGNDDARNEEEYFLEGEDLGLYHYINQRVVKYGKYLIFGYSFIPPSPFQLKDWEKYDVSRYVDPGCIHPTEGFRTTEVNEDIEYASIQSDLESMTMDINLENSIFLFHSPPYDTFLDRAALDGQMIDHVPLDVHVGSIAIKRFIEERKPYITMHGHIHESCRLTGQWMEEIGQTVAFNAAHDGPELSLITFEIENPGKAKRLLL